MTLRCLLLAAATLGLAPLLPSCLWQQQMLTRQEDGMSSLNKALAAVQDKASADAASRMVNQYGFLLRQDMASIISNGRPSLIQLARLRKTYLKNDTIKQESKSALREFFRIYGQGYYGSTSLRQSFIDMLKASPAPTPAA